MVSWGRRRPPTNWRRMTGNVNPASQTRAPAALLDSCKAHRGCEASVPRQPSCCREQAFIRGEPGETPFEIGNRRFQIFAPSPERSCQDRVQRVSFIEDANALLLGANVDMQDQDRSLKIVDHGPDHRGMLYRGLTMAQIVHWHS